MTRSSPSLLFVHTAPLFGPEKFPTRLFLLLDVFRFDLIDQSRLLDVILTRLLNLFQSRRWRIIRDFHALVGVDSRPVERTGPFQTSSKKGSMRQICRYPFTVAAVALFVTWECGDGLTVDQRARTVHDVNVYQQ